MNDLISLTLRCFYVVAFGIVMISIGAGLSWLDDSAKLPPLHGGITVMRSPVDPLIDEKLGHDPTVLFGEMEPAYRDD